jgi:hypothetical protein
MNKLIRHERKYYKSQIEQALHEVELALIDYRCCGETTKAQIERAMLSMGVLSTLANHCHFGNYGSIEKLDKEGWLQERIGAPEEFLKK